MGDPDRNSSIDFRDTYSGLVVLVGDMGAECILSKVGRAAGGD